MTRFVHHHPELPLILVSGTIGEVPKNELKRLVPSILRAVQRAALHRGRLQARAA